MNIDSGNLRAALRTPISASHAIDIAGFHSDRSRSPELWAFLRQERGSPSARAITESIELVKSAQASFGELAWESLAQRETILLLAFLLRAWRPEEPCERLDSPVCPCRLFDQLVDEVPELFVR